MRLLLDTCIVYDWLMGKMNDAHSIERIQEEGALVSVVTPWEMAIKNGLGKMPLPTQRIAEEIEAQGFQWFGISPYHTQSIMSLASFHKDPFDRLLIAQAQYEKLQIMTYDKIFRSYLNDALIIPK